MERDQITLLPALDLEGPGADVVRLERALGLRAEHVGHGRYRIVGGQLEH